MRAIELARISHHHTPTPSRAGGAVVVSLRGHGQEVRSNQAADSRQRTGRTHQDQYLGEEERARGMTPSRGLHSWPPAR